MQKTARTLTRFFGSGLFWKIILGFFVVQALWFVFSAMYPMAFDEDFHLGVIQIYAGQWSPFLESHPAGADAFGAVTRDPSYLFHYLMSFPYRLVAAVTGSEMIQVMTLRVMNVAMFAGGLVVFRRLMLRAGASPALTHVSLAILTLIPIVPQLAAHINYDNLIMLLFPLFCLAILNFVDGLKQRVVDARALCLSILLALFMSVIKYAVLPLLLAAVIFVGSVLFKHFRGRWKDLWPQTLEGIRGLSVVWKWAAFILGVIGVVLCLQRYGVNVVQYKTPVPDCGQVLTVSQCEKYGPWGRDYNLALNKPADFEPSVTYFMREWIEGMWRRLYFAINGPRGAYENFFPLPLPAFGGAALAIMGTVALLAKWRTVFRRNPYLVFFFLTIMVYVAVLWFQQYGMYKETSKAVAINGRYLLPILPLAAVLLGRALQLVLAGRWSVVKPYAATVVLLLCLQGGGVFSFIARSHAGWYWPHNQPVRNVNEAAQKVLRPVIIEGPRQWD